MAELDAILSGDETESVADQPRGEDGRFISTAPPAEPTPEPTPAAPVQAAEPTPPAAPVEPVAVVDHVPQAALLDERRKRQQYERELADMRRELEQLRTPKQPEPPVDVWADPQAAIDAAKRQAVAEAEARLAERMMHVEANLSEKMARRQYKDYDEKRSVFQARLESDPVLQSELNRHVREGGDFGEFVYQTANRLQELEQIKTAGSIDALVEKRLQERLAALKPPTPAVPQSLNAQPSPVATTETWSGPPPLAEILNRKK